MTRLDEFLGPLFEGIKEVIVRKTEVTEPLDPGWKKSTINIPSPKMINSYRKGPLHVHEYVEEYRVHLDRYDPEKHAILHLVDDAPMLLIIWGTVSTLSKEAAEAARGGMEDRMNSLKGTYRTRILVGAASARWEPIAIALPFVLYPYLAMILRPTEQWSLAGKAELETAQAMEGDEVQMTLVLENKGAPIALGTLDLPIPDGLELVKGRPRMPFSMQVGETLHLHFTLRLRRRGFFEFRWIAVRVSDRSLLFTQKFEIWVPATIRVLPHVEDLKRANIEPPRSGSPPATCLPASSVPAQTSSGCGPMCRETSCGASTGRPRRAAST